MQVQSLNGGIAWTVHNVNVGMLVGEYMLNTLRIVPAHFVFTLYYGLAYCVFSWVFFYFHGFFFYFFMDFRRKRGWIAYGVIPLILMGFHLLLSMARY